MPQRSKRQQLIERQDKNAPYLWGDDELPVREDLVAIVREGRYKHTGDRLLDNELLAARMVELLSMRWGVKRVAQELRVAAQSVRAARDALVARGEMLPFKARFVSLCEEIVEMGASGYMRALEEGRVPPAQIPVGVGIFADKRALALGEPTSISVSGSAPLDRSSISVEKLNAWVESLPAAVPARPPPLNSHSSETKQIPEEIP
jgi:hypothetical protein